MRKTRPASVKTDLLGPVPSPVQQYGSLPDRPSSRQVCPAIWRMGIDSPEMYALNEPRIALPFLVKGVEAVGLGREKKGGVNGIGSRHDSVAGRDAEEEEDWMSTPCISTP